MNERRIPIYGTAELVVQWDPTGAVAGHGATGAEDYFRHLSANLGRDPSLFMERVGQIMRASFRRNFEAGGRPPWAPLKKHTQARKQALLNAGRIPRRTPTGRIPRRLLQIDRRTGQKTFGPATILIATGQLRDSWCVKGAKGNVTAIGPDGSLFVGSQLTTERTLPPTKAVRHYHILTKKAQAARQKGAAVPVKVPLARIHEEGAPGANIPARPNATLQPEDLTAIEQAGQEWLAGT